ncbi:hypothetical protein [Acetobacter sp.]|uniref:hypothetical protein n=1 Tax=Acetobacter sp. TaxID=440 RepID=UPI0039E92B42
MLETLTDLLPGQGYRPINHHLRQAAQAVRRAGTTVIRNKGQFCTMLVNLSTVIAGGSEKASACTPRTGRGSP